MLILLLAVSISCAAEPPCDCETKDSDCGRGFGCDDADTGEPETIPTAKIEDRLDKTTAKVDEKIDELDVLIAAVKALPEGTVVPMLVLPVPVLGPVYGPFPSTPLPVSPLPAPYLDPTDMDDTALTSPTGDGATMDPLRPATPTP